VQKQRKLAQNGYNNPNNQNKLQQKRVVFIYIVQQKRITKKVSASEGGKAKITNITKLTPI